LGVQLAKLDLADLGSAKKVVIDKETTTIVEGTGEKEAIQGRIEQIRKELQTTTSDYDKEKLQERLAKLSGGVARINVGAATEAEMKEKKARLEDAIHATKAAVEEGILPGGGVALLRASMVLDTLELVGDERTGSDILRSALEVPIKQLAENGGYDGEVVLQKVKSLSAGREPQGFDVVEGIYTDMIGAGIVDPAKVVRTALQNGASIAALLLTTDALIGEIPEKKSAPGGPGPSPHMHPH
ncbi:MAG: TCP-1/cpn60 chaperonin family protein, partial [Candidatus Brocadiales bacterium]